MGIGARYFLREVAQSFKRNLLLNLSSISTVMVLVFQLGFFIIIILNINNFASMAMNKLQITAILSPDLSITKAGELKQRILRHPEVATARYVSKEQAFEKLKKKMKGKISLNNLSGNPLPNTIEIELKKPEKIKELAEEIGKFPGVEGTRYGDAKLIDKLLRLSYRIYILGVVIIGMLLVSAVFLISNTIRLTVFSRRKEISIMELVGATSWFIRGPFITEGLIHGMVGAGIAVICLNVIYAYGTEWLLEGMPFIPVVPASSISLYLSSGLLAVGIIVGTASSFFSVNKYLKL